MSTLNAKTNVHARGILSLQLLYSHHHVLETNISNTRREILVDGLSSSSNHCSVYFDKIWIKL